MRILYDHQIFTYQRFGGISRYFAELIKCHSNFADADYILGLRESGNESLINTGLAEKHRIKVPSAPDNLLKLSCRYLKNSLYTYKLIKENNFDIFHPTFYFPGMARKLRRKPFVITIVDMIPELFPELYSVSGLYPKHITRNWINGKEELVRNSAAIIAISEKTRNDLVEIYGINPGKVEVIYLGNSLSPATGTSPGLKLPAEYLLFVGGRSGYKNFNRFLNAAAEIMREDRELHMVCIGGGKFSPDEDARIKSHSLAERVKQYNVTDAELYHVYRNARAFVFPSLYEGFGIPIVEAFVAQCPVILSRASCFPEIAGGAAVYFDPEDENSISGSIRQVIYDPGLRKSMQAGGLERSKKFAWLETARKTIAVYDAVLKNN
ncbi:MAG: glycosyltransferase family 1 protein [Victivallaceae bacterium]|nr:glycosyltransferase family 1 protein [Victivallaceae bacterium]